MKLISGKGFLGPIGDDLPSLVPLLIALIIFFSTFTFTFNVFSSRSSDFRADIDSLNVTRMLRSNSYVTGYPNFNSLCSSITVSGTKYYAFVTENIAKGATIEGETIPSYSDFFKPETHFDSCEECTIDGSEPQGANCGDLSSRFNVDWCESDNQCCGEFVCTNIPDDELGYYKNNKDFRMNSKIQPIIIEFEKVARPMHLVVITWQK
jgi:hypothetical protein